MILNLEQSQEPNAVEVRARLHDSEFEQLLGTLDELRVFAAKTIAEKASVIQTGARHSFAKYLLFPVKLRRQFRTDEYDFGRLMCGALTYRDKLYVIYEVPKIGLDRPSSKQDRVASDNRGSSETRPPDMAALQVLEERHRVR